jgi:hypothetical protein
MSAWTEGMWVASGNGVHVGIRCVAITYMEPKEQRNADARIIAAAPELVEALQWALPYVERIRDAEIIRAALKKAGAL